MLHPLTDGPASQKNMSAQGSIPAMNIFLLSYCSRSRTGSISLLCLLMNHVLAVMVNRQMKILVPSDSVGLHICTEN